VSIFFVEPGTKLVVFVTGKEIGASEGAAVPPGGVPSTLDGGIGDDLGSGGVSWMGLPGGASEAPVIGRSTIAGGFGGSGGSTPQQRLEEIGIGMPSRFIGALGWF